MDIYPASMAADVIPFPREYADTHQSVTTEVVAQPIIDLKSGDVAALEFLARLSTPNSSAFLSTQDFLKKASPGRVATLDLEMVGLVANLHAEGLIPRTPELHINLSLDTLNSDMVFYWLLMRLQASSNLLQRVVIEVLEGPGLDKQVLSRLGELRDHGAQIAMDDFGVGYSNYSRLLECQFDRLKIDQSLIAQLPQNDRARRMVASILDLAHQLDLKVIAEGVETQDQAQWLTDNGCPLAQGYLFGKPAPLTHNMFCQLVRSEYSE